MPPWGRWVLALVVAAALHLGVAYLAVPVAPVGGGGNPGGSGQVAIMLGAAGGTPADAPLLDAAATEPLPSQPVAELTLPEAVVQPTPPEQAAGAEPADRAAVTGAEVREVPASRVAEHVPAPVRPSVRVAEAIRPAAPDLPPQPTDVAHDIGNARPMPAEAIDPAPPIAAAPAAAPGPIDGEPADPPPIPDRPAYAVVTTLSGAPPPPAPTPQRERAPVPEPVPPPASEPPPDMASASTGDRLDSRLENGEPGQPDPTAEPTGSVAAGTSQVDAAPPGGGPSAAEIAAAESDYFAALQAHLARAKRYPAHARSRNQEGVVMLGFAIDAAGNLIGARIEQTSGYALLDDAALDMVQRASPMPAIPSDLGRGSLDIVVPVRFTLN